mmetsp:Transcript_3282/g.8659  ORF Transcript_3282/g.8659 Transcript_3282/m.8659 type:complete len:218 (-) Transcript_3282:939-1592(-)
MLLDEVADLAQRRVAGRRHESPLQDLVRPHQVVPQRLLLAPALRLPPHHHRVRRQQDLVQRLLALGVDVRVDSAELVDDQVAKEVAPLDRLGKRLVRLEVLGELLLHEVEAGLVVVEAELPARVELAPGLHEAAQLGREVLGPVGLVHELGNLPLHRVLRVPQQEGAFPPDARVREALNQQLRLAPQRDLPAEEGPVEVLALLHDARAVERAGKHLN